MRSFFASTWRAMVYGIIAALLLMCFSHLLADYGFRCGALSVPWFALGGILLQSMRLSDSRKEATYSHGRNTRATGWVIGSLSCLSAALLAVRFYPDAIRLPYSLRTLWCAFGIGMGSATLFLVVMLILWFRSTPEPQPPPPPAHVP